MMVVRRRNMHAQSMFQWGGTVHAYCENMQKFMEQVASHNGMPATAVPSPPAPPPLPPAYVAASSPNPSLVNVGTFGSSVGIETPEETLIRMAYEGYRCHYLPGCNMHQCVVVFDHFEATKWCLC